MRYFEIFLTVIKTVNMINILVLFHFLLISNFVLAIDPEKTVVVKERVRKELGGSDGDVSVQEFDIESVGTDRRSSIAKRQTGEKINCNFASPPDNGQISCSYQHRSDKECKALCIDNYHFPGGSEMIQYNCKYSDGRWNEIDPIPDCVPSRPGLGCDIKFSEKLNYFCRTSNYKQECTAECQTGYEFSDGETRKQITCNKSTGRYIPSNRFPDCHSINIDIESIGTVRRRSIAKRQTGEKVGCNSVYAPLNGKIICHYSRTNENTKDCKAECIENFHFPGGLPIINYTCRYRNNRWNEIDPIPNCEPSRPGLGCDIKFGANQLPACFITEISERCTVSCRRFYRFSDGGTTKEINCDKTTGIYIPTDTFPDCHYMGSKTVAFKQRVTKEVRDSNGDVSFQDIDVESVGTVLRRSIAKRQTGEKIACNDVSPPKNGWITCYYDYISDKDCEAGCIENFHFPGGSPIYNYTCTYHNNRWKEIDPIPNCEPSRPGLGCNIKLGANQLHDCYTTHLSQQCSVRCEIFYQFSDGRTTKQITCDKSTGVYNPTDRFPDCHYVGPNK